MKTTTITQDDRQTRATIPKSFVDRFKINKRDKMEWDFLEESLVGTLIKNTEEKKEDTEDLNINSNFELIFNQKEESGSS